MNIMLDTLWVQPFDLFHLVIFCGIDIELMLSYVHSYSYYATHITVLISPNPEHIRRVQPGKVDILISKNHVRQILCHVYNHYL